MIDAGLVTAIRSQPWFSAAWSPFALLDTDLRIRAANPAFCRATDSDADQLVGCVADEAFPDRPGEAEAAAGSTFVRSVEEVLRSRATLWLGMHRHDLPDPREPGRWVHRWWLPVQAPVLEDGRLVGVLHHVQDVTGLLDALPAPLAGQVVGPGAEMARALDELRREFPRSAAASVLGVLTDSQLVVTRVLGHPDTGRAVELARLRLEVADRTPAQLDGDGRPPGG